MILPGTPAWLKTPVDERGFPVHAAIVLEVQPDPDTGEIFATCAVEGREAMTVQVRKNGSNKYQGHRVAPYRRRVIPVGDLEVGELTAQDRRQQSVAVAKLLFGLGVAHLSGGHWTHDEANFLGAAMALVKEMTV